MFSLLLGALLGAGWARLRIASGNCPQGTEDCLYLVYIGRGLAVTGFSVLLASAIVNINWATYVERTTVVDPLTIKVLAEKCEHTATIKVPTTLTVISAAPDRWHTELWLIPEARPASVCKVESLAPSSN